MLKPPEKIIVTYDPNMNCGLPIRSPGRELRILGVSEVKRLFEEKCEHEHLRIQKTDIKVGGGIIHEVVNTTREVLGECRRECVWNKWQYVYRPHYNTVYSSGCLIEISDFIDILNEV